MHFSTLEEYSNYLFDRKEENKKIREACDLLGRSDDNIAKVMGDYSLSPKEFIEVIALRRREGYSKSAGNGNVSAENQTDRMYGNTPWKFVEEFLQNADDCKYDKTPEIKITVDDQKGTIEFVYNEEGFTRDDIWALTAFEQSTKSNEIDSLLESEEDGVFYKERTGRKGIGFKSVFSLEAENVCIHIKSNGYSFRLDNAIGRIIPIWEEGHIDDENTHVTVEIQKPSFKFESIFPNFIAIFCADDYTALFKKSPVLFMHRLRDIKVEHISKNGSRDSFGISVEYDSNTQKFDFAFLPEGTILAGIRNQGKYYRKSFSQLQLSISSSSGESKVIPCVRETWMVNIDSRYRNVSIMCPVMKSVEDQKWTTGSLFRTFPMIDNTFDLPFAIDAPFELNSSRKGIEYTNISNGRAFNKCIIDVLFGKEGLFVDFLNYLREIPDIRTDLYFNKSDVILFSNDANTDDYGRRLINEINLTKIMGMQPVFLLYEKDGYGSLNDITSVDPSLFDWMDTDIFLKQYFKDKKSKLAAEIYSDSKIIKHISTVDESFANVINNYLEQVEDRHGIENPEYLSFIENQLYPYLRKEQTSLRKNNSFNSMKVFFSRYKTDNGSIIIREAFGDGQWFHYTGENNLSFDTYRIYESAPVSLKFLWKAMGGIDLNDLSEELGPEAIKTAGKKCTSWEEVKALLKAANYYGFTTDTLKIDTLKSYSVPAEVDIFKVNLFREAGITKVIPIEDIEDLTCIWGDKRQVVERLYALGLRNTTGMGLPDKNNTSVTVLYSDSVSLLQSDVDQCSKRFAALMIKHLLSKGRQIYLSAGNFKRCPLSTRLLFMRSPSCIFDNNYREICESIIDDCKYWVNESNEQSEILVRAKLIAKNSKNIAGKLISFKMKYVVDNNIETILQEVLHKKKFNQFRIENDGCFEPVLIDEIRTKVGILAPSKLESLLNGKLCFYKGNLSNLPDNLRYLMDGTGESVYLHCDQEGSYDSALAHYLNTSFDLKAARYMEELKAQIQDVYTKYIKSAMEQADNNLDDAFHIVSQQFAVISKEEYIKILSWFRMQSYSKSVGNASENSEKEIERDYKDNPWKFIYEFIQNVDDCIFPQDVSPTLGIEVDEDKCSVTFTYNEVGFVPSDIESLTSFGASTKKGLIKEDFPEDGIFDLEPTGRMGRGFKSVFSLPGKDIAVLIQSNGYSFKIFKRLGTIIPVWYPEENVSNNTKITIEGFKEDRVEDIYGRLREWFSVDTPGDFFRRCPLLHLRKLRRVIVTNKYRHFKIDIKRKGSTNYSDNVVDTINKRVVSGIRHNNRFSESCYQTEGISLIEDGKDILNTRALRFTLMAVLANETRAISCVAPISNRSDQLHFKTGGLFRTLPLSVNRINIPLALNGPFATDGGRTKVLDTEPKNNSRVISIIESRIIPSVFALLKTIEDIAIEDYIPRYSDVLFKGYEQIGELDIKEIVYRQPILLLYNGKDYISPGEARKLPDSIYSWPYPDVLARAFLQDADNCLVSDQYTENLINISEIRLLSSDFVENLNRYTDGLWQIDSISLCNTLNKKILPFITEHYDELRRIYRAEKTPEDLKSLQVFVFEFADGSMVLESANEQAIWLKDCPIQYASYGNYRSLNHTHVNYTENQMKWMNELHDIVSFIDAFNKDDFAPTSIENWEEAGTLIETLLYFGIERQFRFTIPYLKKCLLSELFDPEDNLFRDVYLETASAKIADHYISEDDIHAIRDKISKVSPRSSGEIANVIIRLGVRRGTDFFIRSRGSKQTMICNDELISIFGDYCNTSEKAELVVNKVQQVWEKRQGTGKGKDWLSIEYETVRECSPVFFTALFKSNLLEESDMKKLARDFFNSESITSESDPDYAEALLYSASLLNSEKISVERDITISISNIFSRKLGTLVQRVMSLHDSKIDLTILSEGKVNDYSGEQISKALEWLGESQSGQNVISKEYRYYTADIRGAFDAKVPENRMYLIDTNKVILNEHSTEAALRSFVKAQYKNRDNEFWLLMEVISAQEDLKHWKGSKKSFIEALARFRKNTQKIAAVLYPGMSDNINNASSAPMEYIIPELLQNINDCHYSNDANNRLLSIIIDTKTGTMTLSYDEDGFDFSNVYSITAMGQSSKHDRREGEKGLGFKKVFTLFEKVDIYSNGFSFSLNKTEQTVPEWISDPDLSLAEDQKAKTIMIFHTRDYKKMADIAEQWKTVFTTPYAGTNTSPLFLENIAQYKLNIDGKEEYSISRSEILKDYYYFKKPLLATYVSLFQDDISDNERKSIISGITDELRKRTKCSVMTEAEFQDYINNISVCICFPRKIDGKINGMFYSTLPTSNSTSSALFINLPLELNTGRDSIMKDSPFNNCVMDIVFLKRNNKKSIYSLMLEEAAAQLNENQIFEYLKDGIDEWLTVHSSQDPERRRKLVDELSGLKIFHAYQEKQLVSLKESYSVDSVIYQYLNSGIEAENELSEWLHHHYPETATMHMISITRNIVKSTEAVERFIGELQIRNDYYPISNKHKMLAYDYFIDEYRKEVLAND